MSVFEFGIDLDMNQSRLNLVAVPGQSTDLQSFQIILA
jgi:hypothetical protein